MEINFCLVRRLDEVLIRYDDGRELPVRIAWARPIYSRGREICILDANKLAIETLPGPECLDATSRDIAEAELGRRYLIPRIIRVLSTRVYFANRYWHVVTDLGVRRFTMNDPIRNIAWVSASHMVIRDSLGNRYEINPFSALDPFSQEEIMKVI